MIALREEKIQEGYSASNRWHIGVALFWLIILFQLTVLKFIWGLESLATITNMSLLLGLSIIGICSILFFKFPAKVWWYYILPGFFIFLGMGLNMSYNTMKDVTLVSYFGLLLPWASFLAAPVFLRLGIINIEKLWSHYYYFILAIIILSLVEYSLVFAGVYNLHSLAIPNGEFLAGRFTLFHMLEDETPHERLYACLGEPGTLAMWLLPAITYAFLKKRYIGLILLVVAFYFTRSLGGIIGLIVLGILLPFFSIKKKYIVFSIMSFLIAVTLTLTIFSGSIIQQYEHRQDSRTVREENFQVAILNLPVAMVNYPLGLPLDATTDGNEKNKFYFGSNFSPGYAFVLGGALSLGGYVAVLLFSLTLAISSVIKRNLKLEEKVVFLSIIVLFPFVFQRTTIFDSALFALLFAPSLLNALGIIRRNNGT